MVLRDYLLSWFRVHMEKKLSLRASKVPRGGTGSLILLVREPHLEIDLLFNNVLNV